MYLVLGLIFGMVAIVIAPCIVLKTLPCTLAHVSKFPISCSTISLIRFIECIALVSALLIAINYASVVLSATSVCIFDAQVTGHQAYVTMYPILDLAVVLSTCANSALQLSQKSVSHHSSMFCHFLMLKIIPSSLVAIKYLPIIKTACLYDSLGSLVNLIR